MSEIKIQPPRVKTNPDREVDVPTAQKVKGTPGPPVLDRTPKPDENKVRAEFHTEEFIRAISQHGQEVIWRKALICPCYLAAEQQASPDCERCGASGYFYVDPIGIRALMMSADMKTKLYEKMGTWASGQCSITVDPQFRLGFRDSLELRDALMSFDEVIFKANRRGIRSKLPAGSFDTARYRIVNVVFAQYLTGETLHTLESGKHYSVTKDGWLEWTKAANKLLPAKSVITLRYEFHPTYVVDSYPHALRQENVSKKSKRGRTVTGLPLHCVGRLDYLTGDANTRTELPTTW